MKFKLLMPVPDAVALSDPQTAHSSLPVVEPMENIKLLYKLVPPRLMRTKLVPEISSSWVGSLVSPMPCSPGPWFFANKFVVVLRVWLVKPVAVIVLPLEV